MSGAGARGTNRNEPCITPVNNAKQREMAVYYGSSDRFVGTSVLLDGLSVTRDETSDMRFETSDMRFGPAPPVVYRAGTGAARG